MASALAAFFLPVAFTMVVKVGPEAADRAILEVLYSTGIRRMEVINFTRANIHPDRGVLVVRQGKGKKALCTDQ